MIAAILPVSASVGTCVMCALKSPAISERAWPESVPLKLSLNPRTPTSAATPTETDSTTKAKLPGADFRSRQPMDAAA